MHVEGFEDDGSDNEDDEEDVADDVRGLWSHFDGSSVVESGVSVG